MVNVVEPEGEALTVPLLVTDEVEDTETETVSVDVAVTLTVDVVD